MRKDTKNTSAFDLELSSKYRELKASQEKLYAHLAELNKSNKSWQLIKEEMAATFNRLDALKQEIQALVPFDTVVFEKYAVQMFQNMQGVIVNDSILSSYAIRFSSLTLAQKQEFGLRLYQKMAQKYGIKNYSEMEFYIESNDDFAGGYNRDKKITIDTQEVNNFANFISIFIHEFSHYIFRKLPHKSPLNAQMINIAVENYISKNPNNSNFKSYSEQPYEKPSYALMDYFKKNDFVGKLMLAIRARQSISSYDMD
jgi:hypothetical protein